MKKINLKVAAVLLAGTMMGSSCIGSFGLFNKYEQWQCSMTSSKIVNGIVGLILQPIVGGVCLFVDAVVLNTIEFWTGDNPIAFNTIQQIKGQDGRYYAVKTTRHGYEIKSPTGELTLMVYNKKQNSWTISQNGITREILRFNADGTIQANLLNGETITVGNNEAGMASVRQAVADANCYAMR